MGSLSVPTGAEASGKILSSDNNVSQTEQEHAQATDDNKSVTGLMQNLGLASVAGVIQRGQQYKALKTHPRALRTYESPHFDGAWILGDVYNSKISYAERLRRLGVLSEKHIKTQSLAFHGTEIHVGPDFEPSAHISNMHINVPSVPSMVVFSPPHNPDVLRRGFRDPLMDHIKVSITNFDHTSCSLLTTP
jgi:hypothetical protein